MANTELNTLTFIEDGVVIAYALPDVDLQRNGVSQTHSLFIPRNEYPDIYEDLHDTVEIAIHDVLSDILRMRTEPNHDSVEEE